MRLRLRRLVGRSDRFKFFDHSGYRDFGLKRLPLTFADVLGRGSVLPLLVTSAVVSAIAASSHRFAMVGFAALVCLAMIAAPQVALFVGVIAPAVVPVTTSLGYAINPFNMSLFAVLCSVSARIGLAFSHRVRLGPGVGAFLYVAPVLVSAVANLSPAHLVVVSVVPYAALASLTWCLIGIARDDPRLARSVLTALAFTSPGTSLLALYQYLTRSWPILDRFAMSAGYTSTGAGGRAAGTLGHPIVFAVYAFVTLMLSLGLRFRYWRVVAVSSAASLALSGSRGVWLGALVALVIYFVVSGPEGRRHVAAFTRVAALVVLVLVVLEPSLVRSFVVEVNLRLTDIGNQRSVTARQLRTTTAISYVTSSGASLFFGSGPGSGTNFLGQYDFGDGLAAAFDNTYVLIFFEYGLVGLALLVFGHVWLACRPGRHSGRVMFVGLGVAIYSFDIQQWPSVFAAYAAAAALVSIPSTCERSEMHSHPAPGATVATGLLDVESQTNADSQRLKTSRDFNHSGLHVEAK